MTNASRNASSPESRALSFFRELNFVTMASRTGFWLTAMWFYLLPIARQPVLGTLDFWFGLFFVAFPFGLFIYGWNDIGDINDDQFNTRKGNFLFGAKGTREQLRRLPCWILAVHLACGAWLTWRFGAQILWWYAALAVATALYNLPRIGFKRWPVLDVLNQAGYLLVFAMSSIINGVPQAHWATMVFGIAFAMHSHLLGEVLDLEADRLAGRRTTAIVLGRVGSKLVIALFLIGEAVLVTMVFKQVVIAVALIGGALWFVLDAAWLFGPREYPAWLSRFFLYAWNVVAALTAPWMWWSGALSFQR